MTQKDNSEDNKARHLLALYNMIPNLTWSVLNLVPISIFCFNLVTLKVLYVFLAISLFPAFIKNSFLDRIQIGKTTLIYKKLGVHHINKIAQNGMIINRQIRRKYPSYKTVTNKKSSIAKLIGQTYMFEKFHLVAFIFFTLIIIYAILRGKLMWSFIILLTNIAYNVYPNLLQQYIRLKLKGNRKRFG